MRFNVANVEVNPICGVFQDNPNVAVEITFREEHDTGGFIALRGPRKEGTACSEGHPKSPKA